MLITWGDAEFCYWLTIVHLISSVLSLYEGSNGFWKERILPLRYFYDRPAPLVLISFILLICFGTSLLLLPISTVDGHALSLTDAFFMATSATCVTGLSTVSLSEHFGPFGQVVMLILVQIGGLGFMTLSASMTILVGKSMAMKERVLMQDLLNVTGQDELVGMIIDIVKYTFIIELWGTIILTLAFSLQGFEFSKAFYFGLFHSVSAFCNAGFSLFDNSLESFSTTPLIHGTIAILVTLGGLGFIVIKDVREKIFRKQTFMNLTLHTKVVLVTSFILTMLGTAFFFFGEFLGAFEELGIFDKLQVSLFQSITLRTAGFSTIPINGLNVYTIYMMGIFMIIGAAPGSTGGGIKVTTFAILFQSIKSTLKGRRRVEFFDRTIPDQLVVRATAVSIISIFVIAFFIFILMVVEKEQTFLAIYFEVLSAANTVGLSLGITPYFSSFGKIIIALLMFIGRVGPLTMVLAIGRQGKKHGRFEYPYGRLMIG